MLNAETAATLSPSEGSGTIALRKLGGVAYVSIGGNGITLPDMWEHKTIATVPDGYKPKLEMQAAFQTYKGVATIIRININGEITLQPVSPVTDSDSGYYQASFAYPAV